MSLITAPQGKLCEVKFPKDLININFQPTSPLQKFFPPTKTITKISVKYSILYCYPPFLEVPPCLLPSDIPPFPSNYLLPLPFSQFQDVLYNYETNFETSLLINLGFLATEESKYCVKEENEEVDEQKKINDK